MELDRTSIQGNVVPGFNKDHQAFMLVRFGGGEDGRRWLGALQPEIASAKEVDGFKAVFKNLKARRPADPNHRDGGSLHTISSTWVNLAVSFAGLRLLPGAGNVARFPATFKSNRVPSTELPPPSGETHALVMVGADQADDLAAELERQRTRMATCGVEEIRTFRGGTLPGNQRGREHFGFKDAISQPNIVGTDSGIGPAVAAGEFILGQPDQTGQPSGGTLPEWTRNGSFVAFLQLEQHVTVFRTAMQQQAELLGVKPDDVASWMIGRKRDEGDPLDEPPSFMSHIGRAYTRWLPPAESARHRILRRGVPYGTPLKEGEPDDGQRGLLFVTYQADIERQFEHVWGTWLNGPDFPVPGAGQDALVGQDRGRRRASIARPGRTGGSIPLGLPAFVTPRYGGYFFAPSISALSALAGPARPSQGRA